MAKMGRPRGGITALMEAYCIARVRDKLDLTRAWYASHPNAKCAAGTAKQSAWRYEQDSRCQQRMKELEIKTTEVLVAELAAGKKEVMVELWDNAMKSKVDDNFAASTQALIAYGRELGMFRDDGARSPGILDSLGHDDVKKLKGLVDDLLKPAKPAKPARVPKPDAGAASGVKH